MSASRKARPRNARAQRSPGLPAAESRPSHRCAQRVGDRERSQLSARFRGGGTAIRRVAGEKNAGSVLPPQRQRPARSTPARRSSGAQPSALEVDVGHHPLMDTRRSVDSICGRGAVSNLRVSRRRGPRATMAVTCGRRARGAAHRARAQRGNVGRQHEIPRLASARRRCPRGVVTSNAPSVTPASRYCAAAPEPARFRRARSSDRSTPSLRAVPAPPRPDRALERSPGNGNGRACAPVAISSRAQTIRTLRARRPVRDADLVQAVVAPAGRPHSRIEHRGRARWRNAATSALPDGSSVRHPSAS